MGKGSKATHSVRLKGLWMFLVAITMIGAFFSMALIGNSIGPATTSSLTSMTGNTFSFRDWVISSMMGDSSTTIQCSNTKQGKKYITDEKAYTCLREEVEEGCCVNRELRYSCSGCNSTLQCCSEYEFCVSCCLSPTNARSVQDALKRVSRADRIATKGGGTTSAGSLTTSSTNNIDASILTFKSNSHLIFKSARTPFDICSAKCRTSSKSVVFENQYRSSDSKFCYGNQDLPLPLDGSQPNGLYRQKDTKEEIEEVEGEIEMEGEDTETRRTTNGVGGRFGFGIRGLFVNLLVVVLVKRLMFAFLL